MKVEALTPGAMFAGFSLHMSHSRLYLRIPAASVKQKGRSLRGWSSSPGSLLSRQKKFYLFFKASFKSGNQRETRVYLCSHSEKD